MAVNGVETATARELGSHPVTRQSATLLTARSGAAEDCTASGCRPRHQPLLAREGLRSKPLTSSVPLGATGKAL